MDEKIEMHVSDNEWDPEWDAFVASTPFGHHVQTSLWGQVKSALGYRTKRIIASEEGKIVGGGQLLIKRITPWVSIGFMPKGPIYLDGNPIFGKLFSDALDKIVRTNHLRFLALQPPYENSELSKIFFVAGLRPSWLELTSSSTILIDLSQDIEQILAQMKRQTRQNIRRSEREGITCREGDGSDIATFYRFHVATSKRQGFTPYTENYYQKMWQIFKTNDNIRLIISEFAGEAISALLLIAFNDTVIAKILGWSGQYPERRPNDALFWASILWAKSHGYHYFDLEGIDRRCAIKIQQGQPLDEEMKDSYTFFKLGYGGQVVVYPQAYDYIGNPFLRWTYRKIFSIPEHWTNANTALDRIRRRFG